MGLLDRLFGRKKKSKKDKDRKPEGRGRRPPPEMKESGEPASESDWLDDIDEMSAKQLARKLGSGNPNIRYRVEERLGELEARSAMRPLLNTYLMTGDEPALDALKGYGKALTTAVQGMAMDMSNRGERRARIMDVMAVTGDDEVLPAVREGVEDDDPLVRSRACAALVKLGDLHGISRLDQDLQTTDETARKLALHTLIELDVPEAERCVRDHIDRYMADAGAVPPQVTVRSPLLDDADTTLVEHVIAAVEQGSHELTLVVGSAAIDYATARRDAFETAFPDASLHFGTRRMVPEEQIAEVEAARDAATRGDRRAIFVGMTPSPAGDPPLPHILKAAEAGNDFSAKILIVDPHEFAMAQAWWYYMLDKADIPTDVEILLSVSTPGKSAISQEEYELYEMLTSDEQKSKFSRALLARM